MQKPKFAASVPAAAAAIVASFGPTLLALPEGLTVTGEQLKQMKIH